MIQAVYPYKLIPKINQLNSRSHVTDKQGVLLKVKINDAISYADFHNGEEFSDMSLFDLKNYFRGRNLEAISKTNQWLQSLKMASYMLESESSLIDVKSHYLIQDVQKFDRLDLLRLETLNHTKFKVKMGRMLNADTNALKKLFEKSDFNTKFRLDFNESIAKKEFIIWLDKNKEILQKKIEFIEDPIKWDSNQWLHIQSKYHLDLALDMAIDPLTIELKQAPNIIVLKPAVQDTETIVSKFKKTNVNFAVTHYMDHTLGQLGANYISHKLRAELGNRVLDGGLMGFDMFEKHEFSEIRFKEQCFVPGIVFSKPYWGLEYILKQLDWVSL